MAASRNIPLGAGLLALAALLSAAAPARADKIKNGTAVFSGLDKITGRIISFKAAMGETVQFGSLQVTARACYTRPAKEAPQTDTFVEIDEVSTKREFKRVFSGWMFAASPGLHGLEHPIYDIWLTSCETPGDTIVDAPQTADADAVASAPADGVPAAPGTAAPAGSTVPAPPATAAAPKPRPKRVARPAPRPEPAEAPRQEPTSASSRRANIPPTCPRTIPPATGADGAVPASPQPAWSSGRPRASTSSTAAPDHGRVDQASTRPGRFTASASRLR